MPIYVQIIYLCLQYKKKPTILWQVNPSFPYGWIICSKSVIFQKFLQKKENNIFFSKTFLIENKYSTKEKKQQINHFIQQEKIQYPIILKPDNGVGGIGIKFIEDKNKLKNSLHDIKKNYVLQEYISRENELSIFFIKDTDKKTGKIWSITKRSTIKNNKDPELIIPERKVICHDKSHLITKEINNLFNEITNIPGFYFGRFDIRTKDIETFLTTWKDFKILEVNVWAHSIAVQAFDKRYNRREKYNIFFNQMKMAFAIANTNAKLPSAYPDQNFTNFFKWFIDIFE